MKRSLDHWHESVTPLKLEFEVFSLSATGSGTDNFKLVRHGLTGIISGMLVVKAALHRRDGLGRGFRSP